MLQRLPVGKRETYKYLNLTIMKKVLFIAVAALAFAACGNKGVQEEVQAIDSTAVEVVNEAAAVGDSTVADVVTEVTEVTEVENAAK